MNAAYITVVSTTQKFNSRSDYELSILKCHNFVCAIIIAKHSCIKKQVVHFFWLLVSCEE